MAKSKKKELFVDGHGDIREVGLQQYEINWEKIANDVKEAKLLVENKQYEPDDGPLTKSQIKQIKESAPKMKTKTKKTKAKN